MLYKRYAPVMLTVCMRYADNQEEAEDILSKGFITTLKEMSEFNMQDSLEEWIRNIMVTQSLERLRKKVRMFPIISINNTRDKLTYEDEIFSPLTPEELLKMIQELPPIHKMIFNLQVFEGMRHKTIASKIGISEENSRRYLSEAKALLRKRIYNDTIKLQKV